MLSSHVKIQGSTQLKIILNHESDTRPTMRLPYSKNGNPVSILDFLSSMINDVVFYLILAVHKRD